MMQRQFEDEIDLIKESILTMAGMAERALADAGRALVDRDSELALKVIEGDDEAVFDAARDACANAGVGIMRLQRRRLTLEDVFLERLG